MPPHSVYTGRPGDYNLYEFKDRPWRLAAFHIAEFLEELLKERDRFRQALENGIIPEIKEIMTRRSLQIEREKRAAELYTDLMKSQERIDIITDRLLNRDWMFI